MSFDRDGLVFIGIVVLLAVMAYAGAIARRSFGLWLGAYALTLLALFVAYIN